MKKQILFVIDSLHSGGAEKSLVSLLSLFNYEKYEVDLLMFAPTGLYLPLLPKQVKILDVPKFIQRQQKGIKNLLKKRNIRDLYIRLGASLSLRNPFVNNKMHKIQIYWKWVSQRINKLDKKIYDAAIAYSQGMPTYFVAEKVNANRKLCWINTDYRFAPYNKEFDIRYYSQFDNIIAVSDACKNVLIEELPSIESKVIVVYDILSPTLINSMADENGGFLDKYKGLRILTIGRLVHQKGYDMAIKACFKLKREGFEFKWYAIGEGNLKSKLEDMISENGLEDTFIFLGTKQNPYTFLKQSDIYVQPSRYEGYGLAIAEGRILQKPIIATNFTVVHDQIRDGVNGLIVNMSSDDLYKGIKKIIEESSLRNYFSINLSHENVGTEEQIDKIYSLIGS